MRVMLRLFGRDLVEFVVDFEDDVDELEDDEKKDPDKLTAPAHPGGLADTAFAEPRDPDTRVMGFGAGVERPQALR